MLVTSFAAAPAQAATETAWIPLRCALAGSIPVAIGASLTATVPNSVDDGGGTFNLTGASTTTIFPGTAQQAAAVFGANGFQGIIQDFQTHLVNGTVGFANTAGGKVTQSSTTQFDAVAAVQPPNKPATGNPHINGGDTTRGGFQPATPAETFSFGDIPADTSGSTGNRYGPVPGVGGGTNPTDGTPDTLPAIGPITEDGNVGDDVTITNTNPGGTPLVGAGINQPRVVQNQVSFHQGGSPGTYTGALPADCAFDNRPEDPTPDETATCDGSPCEVGDDGSVPKPVSTWVDSFTVPIVAAAPTAPTVSGLNPTHGPAAGGTSVTITGTNLTGATAVAFGANAATNVSVVNDTTVTADAPAGTAGSTVDVSVTTGGGTSDTSGTGDDYTYDTAEPPPDGVGSASARGTDPNASAEVPGVGTVPVTAQYSAITNCDENANTRPFIVRASDGNGQFTTFTRTSTATSTCTSEGSTSVNEGTGAGSFNTNGDVTPATFSWRFEESPDNVVMHFDADNGGTLDVSGAPQALNGTPGGVWVFGTLPWPSSGP